MPWWGWFLLGWPVGVLALLMVSAFSYEIERGIRRVLHRSPPVHRNPLDPIDRRPAIRDEVAETDDKFHGFIRWK